MKTVDIKKHLKYLLICALFTPIWGLIIKVELNISYLIPTFVMMFIMIEILGPISERLFTYKADNSGQPKLQKKITLIYLNRLLLFYLIIIVLMVFVLSFYVVLLHFLKGYGWPDLPSIFIQSIDLIKMTAIALFFTIPIFFFIPWQESMKREFELREQNLIFQNETLSSQVNPHFLFNSLNTLSSLVNTDVEKAGQFINKLSLIYRYILENGKKNRVPLTNELTFIRDYFYLHEIRSEGKIFLNIDIKNADQYEIMPVSLQLLIENAIKHNMATHERPLRISVYNEYDYVVVKNNIQNMATRVASTKTGLKNLRERVRLNIGKEIIVEDDMINFIVKVPLLS